MGNSSQVDGIETRLEMVTDVLRIGKFEAKLLDPVTLALQRGREAHALGHIEAEVFSGCAEDSNREVRGLALSQMEQFPTELASRLLVGRLQAEQDSTLRTKLVQLMVAGSRAEAVLDAARLA